MTRSTVSPTSAKMESTPNADRFLRQLMLLRYQEILKRVCEVFHPSDAQRALMEEKILTIEWLNELEVAT